MVFVWLVNKIAGIFKRHQSEIKESGSEEDFDKLIGVVHEGFERIKNRLDSVDGEIGDIRAKVLSSEVHDSVHDSIKKEILSSCKADHGSFLDNIHTIYNRLDSIEHKYAKGSTGADAELVKMCENAHSKIESIDSTVRRDLLAHIIPLINAVEEKVSALDSNHSSFINELESLKGQVGERASIGINEDVKSAVAVEVKKAMQESGDNNVTTENNNVAPQINNVTTDSSMGDRDNIVATPFKPTKTVITSRNINKFLPSAVIPTFNELLNADKFLSYSELAKLIGKQEATARAYVNDLRNRGVAIDEETKANGRKFIRLAKNVRQEHIIPD